MNQTKDLDNPGFTAYAAGELEGPELESFEAMLGDASVTKELTDIEEMCGLLTECFADEVDTNMAILSEDHTLTDYALGELEEDDLDRVESMLEESPESADELNGIEEMMGLLSESLGAEWRSQESVDVDVPAFTDYALGELAGDEAAEFESMIEYSSEAQKELTETKELISLLSEGLEKEWKSELEAPDHEFSLVEATGEENVVAVNFSQAASGSARSAKNHAPALISLAAVLAGLLVVGGLLSRSGTGQNSVAIAPIGFSSDEHVWVAEGDRSAEVAEAPIESSFNVRLLDELGHAADDFVLADFEPQGTYYLGDSEPKGIDPYYLGGNTGTFVPASMQPEQYDDNTFFDSPIQGLEMFIFDQISDQYKLDVMIDSKPTVDVKSELNTIILELGVPGADVAALQKRLRQVADQVVF